MVSGIIVWINPFPLGGTADPRLTSSKSAIEPQAPVVSSAPGQSGRRRSASRHVHCSC